MLQPSVGADGVVYDWLARALVVLLVLNVNGIASMAMGWERAASILIFATALPLIAKHGRYAWSLPFIFLLLAIMAYLVFGSLFHSQFASAAVLNSLVVANTGTMIIIWALAGYVSSIALISDKLNRFFTFLRNVALFAAGSVLASPLLYDIYVTRPPSSDSRWGGFFGNPNEAALVSVLALALTYALPLKSISKQWVAITVAVIAIVLTFSKTALLAGCVIIAIEFMRRARGASFILVPLVAALAISFLQEPRLYFDAIASQQAIPLEQEQQARLHEVGVLLSGQINEQTTTGRTLVWQMGLDRAVRAFPGGYGLGSFHALEGGIFESGTWLGVHNTFLMYWGESGVFPLILLVVALVTAGVAFARGASSLGAMSIMVVLWADLLGTHAAMITRYDNVIMGLLFGVAAAVGRGRNIKRRVPVRKVMPWEQGGAALRPPKIG